MRLFLKRWPGEINRSKETEADASVTEPKMTLMIPVLLTLIWTNSNMLDVKWVSSSSLASWWWTIFQLNLLLWLIYCWMCTAASHRLSRGCKLGLRMWRWLYAASLLPLNTGVSSGCLLCFCYCDVLGVTNNHKVFSLSNDSYKCSLESIWLACFSCMTSMARAEMK